jgi:ribosomal protein S18 acetylase RimI-like enzyme
MVQGISTNPYRIVPFMKEYIDGIVGLHMQAFSGFFLSSLGRGFLSEYYRCAVGHELSVGYVAVDCDNKVVGLCFGLVDPKSFYKDILKRRWWVFALHSIWAVFRQPIIIPRLLRALKHEGGAPPVNITPLGSLVVTAVKPDDQGVGVAITVMRSLFDEFVRRGVHAVFLNTDADNNDRIRGFYLAMECDFVDYYFTPEGRRMCWYLWQDPKTRKPIEKVVRKNL